MIHSTIEQRLQILHGDDCTIQAVQPVDRLVTRWCVKQADGSEYVYEVPDCAMLSDERYNEIVETLCSFMIVASS